MGTLLNGSIKTYRIILKSAADFPESQFVLSVGNARQIEDVGELRIAHYGAGEFIRVEEELTSERLTTLIKTVLNTPSYRENARNLQSIIEQARGPDVAADVIETACMDVRAPAGIMA